MQEADAKAVYIVEPISRNHKNHTNHSVSLLSGCVVRRRDLYFLIISEHHNIATVLRGVDSLSSTRRC